LKLHLRICNTLLSENGQLILGFFSKVSIYYYIHIYLFIARGIRLGLYGIRSQVYSRLIEPLLI